MEYKKELGQSLYESVRITAYTAAITYILKKTGLIAQPCVKFDIMDILKLSAVVTPAIIVDDYAVSKGWYPDKLKV